MLIPSRDGAYFIDVQNQSAMMQISKVCRDLAPVEHTITKLDLEIFLNTVWRIGGYTPFFQDGHFVRVSQYCDLGYRTHDLVSFKFPSHNAQSSIRTIIRDECVFSQSLVIPLVGPYIKDKEKHQNEIQGYCQYPLMLLFSEQT
ncbi:uncharacterized protein ARMOST_06085 [Armillaria ostoyae]|uniref:Uncharacterized protein n=1 Tax=Armillaria ostoyae TaxID=47428 RepID=A0A284R1Z9_ARMOS|nr:uncharacterized protein ARMOST_06085 [Armillaria ostoyae]